jgi:hypothetical protein
LSRQSTPDEDDDDYIPLEMSQMQLIRLSDAEAVAQYYEDVFKGIQQLALKLILKEWIKVIEPKKQKNFPYKKEIRPTWWPDAAAYKEPDHIKLDGWCPPCPIVGHLTNLEQIASISLWLSFAMHRTQPH